MDISAVKQGTGEECWEWEIQGGKSERQFGTAVLTLIYRGLEQTARKAG